MRKEGIQYYSHVEKSFLIGSVIFDTVLKSGFKSYLRPSCTLARQKMAASPPPPNFWGSAPESEFYASLGVSNSKSFFPTPYGRLFTQSWLPAGGAPPRGLVFCTHGYGSDSNWMFQKIPIAFALWGYAAYAADLLGHGQSEGLHGYIEDVETTAAASLFFFQAVRDRVENKGLKKFLFGESMGGGMTFLMLLKDPQGWDGAIFSAPLFIMPEPMKPSGMHLFGYSLLLGFAEKWPVMPQRNVIGKALRDPGKAKVVMQNPRRYRMPARVGTMRQLCRMCEIFRRRCGEVAAPFLVVHGTGDNITAYEGGEVLCDRAKSSDKTLKLYDGMYHSLIQAELDENIERVLADIRAWIDARATTAPPTAAQPLNSLPFH